MLNKSYILVPLVLLFTACTNEQVVQKSDHIINTNKKSNEVVISYEEYLKLLESGDITNKQAPKSYKPLKTVKKTSDEEVNNSINEIAKESNSTPSNDEEISQALMDFYEEWKDVKYKFGGTSKKGIDCSSFTQKFFKEKLHINIPRSTRTQVNIGTEIDRKNLQLGDLVFFKTGGSDRHVGIYMGNGDFLHASIKGIKFTKLDKPFYKKAYWTSRRVIE